MNVRPVTLILAVAVALACASRAAAQAVVSVRADTQTAYVGEAFIVAVEIERFETCEEPVFPKVDGCDVVPLGKTADGIFIINTQQRLSRTYSYQVTPRQAGRLVIPPVKVRVDEREIVSRPLTLAVQASDAEELLDVEIGCDEQRVYVGQRIRLTMTIWLKPAAAGGRQLTGRDMFQFIERDGFGPFPLPERYRERNWNAPDGSNPLYYAYESSADYVPTRPGPLALDDVRILVEYPTRFGRDVFGSLTVTGRRRLLARPKVAAVEVLPMPTDSRPDTFAGAVGRYTINVEASPTTVRVGDPIELRIELRGDGVLDTLPPPVLTANHELMAHFRVPSEALAGETRDGRRRFTQTIRAASSDVREIPPIEYAYFDTAVGEYRVARSAAIPLSVAAAERVDAGDFVTAAPRPERAEDLGPLDGLRGNETEERLLLLSTAPPRIEYVAAAVLVPPACFVLLWGFQIFAQARNGDGQRRRRLAARGEALRRLRNARALPAEERAAAISAALAGYLADRAGDSPARFVGRGAAEYLRSRGVADTDAQEWDTLLARCEQASFGGGTVEPADDLLSAAQGCLERAERLRL